jgi:hypothetical protein
MTPSSTKREKMSLTKIVSHFTAESTLFMAGRNDFADSIDLI